MKIAIVCPNDFSIVNFCGEFVNQLEQNNNKIYVISGVHGEHGEKTSGYYKDIMDSWGICHLPIKYYRFFSISKDLRYIYSLYKIIKNNDFDLVINIATKANIYCTIVSKILRVPKIVCCNWGLGVVFSENINLKVKLIRFILIKLYWISFKLSDKIWFTNKFDYEWFIKDGIMDKEKSFLTKNYVNTNDYSPTIADENKKLKLKEDLGLNSDDKIVVMIARMSWAKGVKEFVDSANIFRKKYNKVKFILIGPLDDGSADSVPESYLNENQNHNNFIWTGFKKDVKTFYAISHLAVLPTYYREGGYPRGLTEAMAMGKPIIATDSVHCRGTIENGKNGYHVPIKSSEGLADAIEKIITDESKIKSFGIYSRQKALDEFDEKKIISQVISNIL